MTFKEKIKTTVFWKKTLQIAGVFFVILIILSLLLNSYSSLFDLDMAGVLEKNFTEGKWIRFFSSKVLVSVLYGMWLTHKNLR